MENNYGALSLGEIIIWKILYAYGQSCDTTEHTYEFINGAVLFFFYLIGAHSVSDI